MLVQKVNVSLSTALTYPDARRSGARPSSLVSQLPRRSQYLPPLEPPDLCSSFRGKPRAGFPTAVSRACAVMGGLAIVIVVFPVALDGEEDAERWFAIRSSRSWGVFGIKQLQESAWRLETGDTQEEF